MTPKLSLELGRLLARLVDGEMGRRISLSRLIWLRMASGSSKFMLSKMRLALGEPDGQNQLRETGGGFAFPLQRIARHLSDWC